MGEQVAGFVRELVFRILPRENLEEEGAERAYQCAMRIVGSRITTSLASDEATIVESMKRQFVHQGRSSDALTFTDLYRRFSAQLSIDNKWALLYLLRAISEDQKKEMGSRSIFTSTVSPRASMCGLHAVPDGCRVSQLYNNNNKTLDQYKTLDHYKTLDQQKGLDINQSNRMLLLSKDPENGRALAFREYMEVCRDVSEVTEGALVRDVLYACQGIDGRFLKFDKDLDGFAVVESYRVPKGMFLLVRRVCELGWLYKKVKNYISESVQRDSIEMIGTVRQAFCAALQEELSDYYKLLAVLEGQVHNPIPVMEEGKSMENYLSLRRLMVWLAEPTVRMRLMAVLVDNCKSLRGGAMAGAIHMHAQHGDPLVRDFMKRLLKRVCSPLFEMVRSWVLQGELNDVYSEFFVIGQVARPKIEALWRDGYRLHSAMLPSFIPEPLAIRILRTGKSINFLRVCCEDQGWADAAAEAAAAAGTSTRRDGLGYGKPEALEMFVVEAAKRIDRHLIEIMDGRYKFREHCFAIKRYLLLGQGDFIQYLMDIVGPDLSQPANTISSFKLAGLLESAIRASNAQYDDPDILDRLRVKMMPHNSGDMGWDVFSLEYNTMKPNCTVARLFAAKHSGGKLQIVAVLRRCQTLRNEMNHFVTNLQYYIMFEVLEYSWADFLDEMEQARDFDELIAAHEKYLNSIAEKSLLGERSQQLCKTLFALFDLILRFQSHADRLYESAHGMQARGETLSKYKPKIEPQRSGLCVGRGGKFLLQLTGECLRTLGEEMDAVVVEHSSLLEGFIAQLPLQHHVDLKFLSFRLDFTEFYSQQHVNMPTAPIKSRRTSLRGEKQSQNA